MDFNAVKEGTEKGSFVLIDVRNKDEVASAGKIPKSQVVPRKWLSMPLIVSICKMHFFSSKYNESKG